MMENININNEKELFIADFPAYKADIEHFFTYLTQNHNFTPSDKNNLFRAIDHKIVLNCLEDLCEKGIFKTESKSNFFIHALAKFFNRLLSKGLPNEKLRKELKYNFDGQAPYYEKLTTYILDTPELEKIKSFSPLDSDSIELLIEHCNELISKRIFYMKGSEPKIFSQMASALCIKLILFSGICYNTAKSLEFRNLNMKFRLLDINGIPIILPPELSYQFGEYSKIYIEKGLNVDGSKLFVGRDGKPWGNKTSHSGIPAVLRAALSKTSISEINRFAIQQQIENGLPERTILKLTGETREVIKKCYDEEQENDNGFSFVNSALVKSPIYSKL